VPLPGPALTTPSAALAAGLEHTAIHGAGWVLPVEPLLRVMRAPETWSGARERISASAM
jgi:hypothetical protein